jgi:hypothetical protein
MEDVESSTFKFFLYYSFLDFIEAPVYLIVRFKVFSAATVKSTCLLRCEAVRSDNSLPIFRKNVMLTYMRFEEGSDQAIRKEQTPLPDHTVSHSRRHYSLYVFFSLALQPLWALAAF